MLYALIGIRLMFSVIRLQEIGCNKASQNWMKYFEAFIIFILIEN